MALLQLTPTRAAAKRKAPQRAHDDSSLCCVVSCRSFLSKMLHFSPVGAKQQMRDVGELRFGRFRLQRRQRRLLMDGVPIDCGARALDILLALIDADGAPVSKDELMSRVWPGMVVEEQNVTAQIHALRKLLGPDKLIRTVSRHGYSFIGNVEKLSTPPPTNAEAVLLVSFFAAARKSSSVSGAPSMPACSNQSLRQ